MLLFFTTTLLEPHPATKQMAADVSLALRRAGISQKEAAIDMAIGEAVLSEQLAGHKHLSLWRLTRLPAAFWTEFDAIRAERRGDVIWRKAQVDLIRDVATCERRMVKMDAADPRKARIG